MNGLKFGRRKNFIFFLALGIISGPFETRIFSQDENPKSVLILAPLAGITKVDVEYSVSNSPVKQNLNESGPLYGAHMLLVNPKFVIATLAHYSELDKGKENGYLLTGYYYFREKQKWQPMLGSSIEYIHARAELGLSDVAPLNSLDVDTSIWAFYPLVGISFKTGMFRISPYVAYLKETVETIASSDGIRTAGQLRNGFRRKSYADLDYFSAGSKLEVSFGHFVRYDGKFYIRCRDGEENHITTRNRLDVYLTKKLAISAKIDYFQDKYETMTLFMFGPAIVF